MNLTLGCLTELKVHLLNESIRAQTTWDDSLAALGSGVAGLFERTCNRRFWRTAGDTYQCDAARTTIALPRFPLESIASIALRYELTGGWTTLSGVIRNQDEAAGLVWLQAMQAEYPAQLRVTYTGGYWFPDLDEDEDASDKPSGAYDRPPELFQAWLTQCELLWNAHDALGTGIAQEKGATFFSSTLAAIELAPSVRQALASFVRHAG